MKDMFLYLTFRCSNKPIGYNQQKKCTDSDYPRQKQSRGKTVLACQPWKPASLLRSPKTSVQITFVVSGTAKLIFSDLAGERQNTDEEMGAGLIGPRNTRQEYKTKT